MKATLQNTEKQHKVESELTIGPLAVPFILEHIQRLQDKHESYDF